MTQDENQAGGVRLPVGSGTEIDVMETIEADSSKKRRYDANKKSVRKAYLLWLLLGFFGGHRFYLGYFPSAIFLILMTTLALIMMLIHYVGVFLLFLPGLWLLVDGFIIPAIVRHQNEELVSQILR